MLIPLTESVSIDQVCSMYLQKIANMLLKGDSISRFLWVLEMSMGAEKVMVSLISDEQLFAGSCADYNQLCRYFYGLEGVQRVKKECCRCLGSCVN